MTAPVTINFQNANKQLGLDELSGQYGYAAAFFDSDPELKALITQAVQEQWSADNFKAKFMATNWYRNNTEAMKQWNELESRNPAEAQQRVSSKMTDLWAQASQLGIVVSSDRMQQIAHDSLAMGWSDQMVKNALAAEWSYSSSGTGTSGTAADTENKIRSLAADYGVSFSNDTLGTMIGGVLSGKYTDANIGDMVRDQARSKYPGMSGYLDQGFTVRQIASPYTQSYAQLLEKDPQSVDLTDPLIQRALQGAVDPKTKTSQMQSVFDFEQSVRKDPRWLQTQNAHDSMESVGLRILQDFGLHSGG